MSDDLTQRRYFLYAGVILVFLLISHVGAAFAQEHHDPHDEASQAESHYSLAVRFFGEGRYREAVEEFDRAIEIAPEAVFYCNRAVVLIKLQEIDKALASMNVCRDSFEGDAEELAQIDAETKALAVFARHLRPHSAGLARDIAAGPLVVVAPEHRPPSARWGKSDYGYLSLGAGAALLASAAMLDWLSADVRDEFIVQSQGGPGTSLARHQELEDTLRSRQRLFAGLTISGAVLAVTGGALLTYHFVSHDEATSGPVSLNPVLGRDSVTMQIALDF